MPRVPAGAGPRVVETYRPDIDGLRALAVGAVVLFHAGLPAMPGGFVGVDVFFVISGYLIGGQIFRKAAAGSFSFIDFYTRRVRRILPALYALILLCLCLGAVILTPLEMRQFGKEASAALLGLSNVLYYTGGGYFAPAAEYSPLLMTWSLGVEEQFYLFFPILILASLRIGLPIGPVLLAGTAISFLGSLLLLAHDPNAAFYLLPTRAWELGIGAALALRGERSGPVETAGRWQDLMAAIGLGLIVVSVVAYRKAYAFPGLFALLPTMGALLVIASPAARINVHALSMPAMTFVGRISYSWYLWHWPLFYLNRVIGGADAGLSPPVLVVVSFGLGAASWRFVERPFRYRSTPGGRMLAGYAAAGLGLLVTCAALYHADGWPGRFAQPIQAMSESVRQSRENPCLASFGAVVPGRAAACLPIDGRERLVLIGDSHASALAPGLRGLADRHGLGFGEMTKSSCHPFSGVAAETPARPQLWSECIAFQRAVFATIERRADIRVVVLAGFWSSSETGFRPAAPPPGTPAGAATDLASALETAVRRLQMAGRTVLLVQDVPKFRFDPYERVIGDLIPARAALRAWLSDQAAGRLSASPDEILPDPSVAVIAGVAERTGAGLLDPAAYLCRAQACDYARADALYYFDFQHLTAQGAQAAVGDFRINAVRAP